MADLVVHPACPPLDCDLVFSGLDAGVATEIEKAFAEAGYPVISNARSYRMAPDVPLLIPEVNAEHIALIDDQSWGDKGGFIVTNPNCSTVGLVLALKPLHDRFGVESAHVVTMQALSGAGYPGVSALDALGNVVPYIGGEEEKMARETQKLLGTLTNEGVVDADVVISAQCNRVPIIDGHTECVSVRLTSPATPEEVAEAMRAWESPLRALNLYTAPLWPLRVFSEEHYPQPRRHARAEGGMQASVGRVQACRAIARDGYGIKFVVLSHNTIRGAAGGAILNAELLYTQGRLTSRRAEAQG